MRLDRICLCFWWAARCWGWGGARKFILLPDLPAIACVVATPEIGVSTPKAFADWDLWAAGGPQGLKPDFSAHPNGPAEAVPFHVNANVSEWNWDIHSCRASLDLDGRGRPSPHSQTTRPLN